MSFSYSGDPSASPLDGVRYEVGDTVSAGHLVEDEEILYVLGTHSGLWAAAAVAERIASRFGATGGARKIGGMSIDYGVRAQAFRDLAKSLRVRAGREGLSISVGGQSQSGLDADTLDVDKTQPAFRTDDGQYPGHWLRSRR